MDLGLGFGGRVSILSFSREERSSEERDGEDNDNGERMETERKWEESRVLLD